MTSYPAFKRLSLYPAYKRLLLAILLGMSMAAAAPLQGVTFDLSAPTNLVNRLDIQLELEGFPPESDLSDLSGFLDVDLGMQIVGGALMATELNLTGGSIMFTDISYALAFGTLNIDGTGMKGTVMTVNPPSVVTGGDFNAAEQELIINEGIFTVTGLISDVFDLSTDPLSGMGSATESGRIDLSVTGTAPGQVMYQATLTLPIAFTDLVQDTTQGDPVNLLLIVDGDLEATSTFTLFDSDFDLNLAVDGHDFLTWQRGNGTMGTATRDEGDANSDNDVNELDLFVWQGQFGAPTTVSNSMVSTSTVVTVPEPGTLVLLLLMGSLLVLPRSRTL